MSENLVLSVDITFRCYTYNDELSATDRGDNNIDIEPCSNCLDKQREEGLAEGYTTGREDEKTGATERY